MATESSNQQSNIQTQVPSQPSTNANPHQVQPPIALDKIHLSVRNRSQILFDNDVKAVTSFNDAGRFDVLPTHSNFISVINQAIIIHKLDGTEQTITLANGVLKVKDSKVHGYIDLLSAKPTTQMNKEASSE